MQINWVNSIYFNKFELVPNILVLILMTFSLDMDWVYDVLCDNINIDCITLICA